MNNISAEKMLENWNEFLNNIKTNISEPRRKQLLNFYKKHEEELMLMPASHKRAYHNAIPGGYIDHVNRVISVSQSLYILWKKMGMDSSTFTKEELMFSAINHDLGKMGNDDGEYIHLPSKDAWRKKNLGENYSFNTKIQFMKVPDRGLYILQKNRILVSENEYIAIQTHDGLYDPGNEVYLKSFMPETKFRSSLPYILHQADMLASRIEFETEYSGEFKNNVESPKKGFILKDKTNSTISNLSLSSIKSQGLKDMLNKI